MRFTAKTLGLCQKKYGKGSLVGFEEILDQQKEIVPDEIQSEIQHLIEDGIIDVGEEVHISALGQHIFRMMLEPEQYICIDNKAKKECLRMYIRDAYYLCVLERANEEPTNEKKYTFKLLPTMDMVVGGFTHAIREKNAAEQHDDKDIMIEKKAWDRDRNLVSSTSLKGTVYGHMIRYKESDLLSEQTMEEEYRESDECDLVNGVTKWLFYSISELENRG